MRQIKSSSPHTTLADLVYAVFSANSYSDRSADSSNLSLAEELILVIDRFSNLLGILSEIDLLRGVSVQLQNPEKGLNALDLLGLQEQINYLEVPRSLTAFEALAKYEQSQIQYFLTLDPTTNEHQVYGLADILQDLQQSALLKSDRVKKVVDTIPILLSGDVSFGDAILSMLRHKKDYLVFSFPKEEFFKSEFSLLAALDILKLWLHNHHNPEFGNTTLKQLNSLFESKSELKHSDSVSPQITLWAAYRELQKREVRHSLVVERSLLNQTEKLIGIISPVHFLKLFSLESIYNSVESLQQNLNRALAEKASLLLNCIDRVGIGDLATTNISQSELEQEYKIALATLNIRQSFSLEEIYETTVAEVVSWLQGDRVILCRFSEDGTEKIVSESVISPQFSMISQSINHSFLESDGSEFYDRGIARVIDDLTTAEMVEEDRQFLSQYQVKSSLAVAIPQGKKLWGLLIIHQCVAPRQWQASEIEFLERLAPRLSINFHQAALLTNSLTEFDERRVVEKKLFHNTLHDPLTDLPNRILVFERIDFLLKQSTACFGLLLFDLNRFKLINEGLGHLVGDRVLLELVARLVKIVNPADMVARIGGDEFVILMENLPSDQERTDQVIQLIEDLQVQLQKPFNLIVQGEEHSVTLSACVGIVLSKDHFESIQVLRDAEAAMQFAKGKSQPYAFFAESMRQEVLIRLGLENDLRKALANQELSLQYQPVIAPDSDLISGKIVGFEALLRWTHSQRGSVYPLDFIPILEETGLILPIGNWVMFQACQQMYQWQQQFGLRSNLTISVNVSNVQVEQPDFVESLQRVLENTGLSPSSLHLEITESVLMQNMTQTHKKLKTLRSLGVEIHIDDFGTGYSSLSYIHNLPIDGLKIDRSFMIRINEDDSSRQIVQAIINLAKSIGKSIVAEGVETQAQLSSFMEMGQEHVQGYYFSKPVDADRAGELIEYGLPKLD
jgi:diguanylate cyclase (GGDEF)-like protein